MGGVCQLCQREAKRGTTEHHLIPRALHSNKWFRKRFTREQMRETISVCHECHRAIHKLIPSEKELGRHFNSVSRLLEHQALARFVAWVAHQR